MALKSYEHTSSKAYVHNLIKPLVGKVHTKISNEVEAPLVGFELVEK